MHHTCPLITRLKVKFLGSYLDPKLSWSCQIDHICKKLNSSYFALLKLKHTVTPATLLQIYYSLVYPHLSYNIILWGTATEINRVFVAQKRTIRLMFNLGNRDSCREYFKEKKILTVIGIFILKCGIFVHKNLHLFAKNQDNHNYITRNAKQLRIPSHNTSKYEKSPHYSCIRIYNTIPKYIRDCMNIHKFARQLKNLLLDHSFYCLDEFYKINNINN